MLLKDLIPDTFDEWRYERTQFSPRTHGSHWSPIRRTTRMPAPSRRYVPGDPIRAIDWRAWARTDQLLVREMREDAAVAVEVHFEATAAMDWPDQSVPKHARSDTPSKIDWVWRVACNICMGHVRMGDRVTLMIWTEEPDEKDALRLHWRRQMPGVQAIREVYAVGPRVLLTSQVASQDVEMPSVDTIYWLGDALTDSIAMEATLSRAQSGAFLHCLSGLEVNIGWIDSGHSYVDREPARREFLGESLRLATLYSDRLRQWQGGFSHWCEERGLAHGVFTDQTPVESYLRFLSTVGARIRGQGTTTL